MIVCSGLIALSLARQIGELSTSPILTLSPANCLAGSAIFASRSGDRLVSGCSEGDRAIRVWNLNTRRLVRTIVPPYDQGGAGHLGPFAMNSTGRLLAVGTNSPAPWNAGFAVYLFDLASGEMCGRISGLRSPVTGLAMSSNADRLAVGFAGGEVRGVHFYSLGAKIKEIGADENWKAQILGMDFSPDGTLVACSPDGMVKTYAADGSAIGQAKSNVGGLTVAKISPNGRSVVLSGSFAQGGLELRSSAGLALVGKLDAGGVRQGSFDIPCWSNDGTSVAAMFGAIDDDGRLLLRTWNAANCQRLGDVSLVRRAGASITAYKDRFLVGLADGSIWDVQSGKAPYAFIDAARPDFVNVDGGYKGFAGEFGPHAMADSDLGQLGFPLRDEGRNWLHFDVRGRRARLLPISPTLRFPILQLPQVAIEPRMTHGSLWGMALNGVGMEQPPGNVTYCHVLLTNPTRVVTGSLWSVQAYDSSGKPLWRQPASREVRQVVGSSDGSAVATVSADGIMVWRRASNGTPFLFGFVNPETLDWVLWTPSGYYDASPGAEPWLRWLVNRGPDKSANLVRLATYRDKLCRPDVIDQIIKLHDEAEALAEANRLSQIPEELLAAGDLAAKVPTIKVEQVDIVWNDPAWDVRAMVTIDGGAEVPLDRAELRVGGVAIAASDRPIRGESFELRGSTSRPPSVASVVLRSDDRAFESDPVEVPPARVVPITSMGPVHIGNPPPTRTRSSESGAPEAGPTTGPRTLHVVAVGIDVYENKAVDGGKSSLLTPLRAAVSDAKAFASAISRHLPPSFTKTNVHLLLGSDATYANFDRLMSSLPASPGDIVVMYFAGHGLDVRGQFVLPLFDYKPTDQLHTSLDAFSLARYSWAISQCARWLVVDACNAGALTRKFANMLGSDATGYAVFAACQATEQAREDGSSGYFTKALIEGLDGPGAIRGSSRISIGSLQSFLDEKFQQPPLNALGQTPSFATGDMARIYVADKR